MRLPTPLALTKLMVVGQRQPITRSRRRRAGRRWSSCTAGRGTARALSLGRVPFADRDVDFLPAVRALHDAGTHGYGCIAEHADEVAAFFSDHR